jgi:hypothetical protein
VQNNLFGQADLLLLGIGFNVEIDDKGNVIGKALKWHTKLNEIQNDTIKKEILASDYLKRLGILFLANSEETKKLAIPDPLTPEWEEQWKEFCSIAESLDGALTIKKRKGASPSFDAFFLSALISSNKMAGKSSEHSDSQQYLNYFGLIFAALRMRLARSVDFSKHRSEFEKQKTIEREMKAATTAVNRQWKKQFPDNPQTISKKDKEFIEHAVTGSLTDSDIKGFMERLLTKFPSPLAIK